MRLLCVATAFGLCLAIGTRLEPGYPPTLGEDTHHVSIQHNVDQWLLFRQHTALNLGETD